MRGPRRVRHTQCSDLRESVFAGAVLGEKHDQHNPSDERHQADQLPPAAAIGVMQSARRRRDGWQQGRQGKDTAENLADRREAQADKNHEQHEPPVFGAARAPAEIRIFAEAHPHGFLKRHVFFPRLISEK